jgi:putative peptidoglycan lipid II flippase
MDSDTDKLSRRREMAGSVAAFGVGTGVSRILGLAREMAFAYLFGAGRAMDSFYVAFRIPNLLRDLFAEGSLNAAFVPVFTETLSQKGKEQAWRLASLVANSILVVVGGLVVVGVVASPVIVKVIAFGFGQVPGKLALTGLLTRVMFPFLLLVALAALSMGILNSFRRFFITGLAPSLFNLGVLASAFLLCPLMARIGQPPVLGLAIGVLIGGTGQLLVQLPFVFRQGFRYRPVFALKDPALGRVMRLVLPVMTGLAATKINIVINTFLASLLAEGSVSYLTYAYRLMQLPLGLFGVAVATVSLPTLSRIRAEENMESVRKTTSSSFQMVLFLTLPAQFILLALSQPICRLLYQRGSFSAEDALLTAQALMLYSIGIAAVASTKVLASAFYALEDSKTPMRVSILCVGANVAINLVLMRVLAFRAFALSTSLAALLNMGLLLWLLSGRIGGLEVVRLVRLVGISAASGAVAYGVAWAWGTSWVAPGLVGLLVQVILALVVGLFFYLFVSRWANIEEASLLVARGLRVLKRRSQ